MICKTQKKCTLRDKIYFIHTSCIPTKPFNCFMQSLRTRTTFNVLLYIINVFVNMIYQLLSVLHVLHSVLKRFTLQDDPFLRIFHTVFQKLNFFHQYCCLKLKILLVALLNLFISVAQRSYRDQACCLIFQIFCLVLKIVAYKRCL